MLAGAEADSARAHNRWKDYLVEGEQYIVTNFFGGQCELACPLPHSHPDAPYTQRISSSTSSMLFMPRNS